METQNEEIIVASPKKSNGLLISIISIIVAIICGGVAYGYQAKNSENDQKDLQAQIDSLKSEVALLKASPTPTASPSTTVTPTASPAVATALSESQLLNFTYKDDNGVNRKLINGKTTFSVMGSEGSLTIEQDYTKSGDLDGDGSIDSVVVLVDNQGGTGFFRSIAVVLNKNGEPQLADQHSILGDRDDINSVSISNGTISVVGKIHGPGQVSSDTPNLDSTEVYKLVSGKLVKQ